MGSEEGIRTSVSTPLPPATSRTAVLIFPELQWRASAALRLERGDPIVDLNLDGGKELVRQIRHHRAALAARELVAVALIVEAADEAHGMSEFGRRRAEQAASPPTKNDGQNERLGDEGHSEGECGIWTAREEQTNNDEHAGDRLNDGEEDQEASPAEGREAFRISGPVGPAEHRDATILDSSTVLLFDGPLCKFRVDDASHVTDLSVVQALVVRRQAGRRWPEQIRREARESGSR